MVEDNFYLIIGLCYPIYADQKMEENIVSVNENDSSPVTVR